MMIAAPLVIRPKGWTPVSKSWTERRDDGLHEFTVKRDENTGRVAGNDRGPSFEHRPPTTMGSYGRQHAAVRMTTIELRIPGLTRTALLAAVRESIHLFPDQQPRLTPTGIVIPGRQTAWH